jgi:hypothetical protein
MSIKFITLTNTGYIDYTLNCLESLNRIKSSFIPHSYCVGEEAYNILKNKGYDCTLINNDETVQKFQTFGYRNFHDITYYKFPIIYENLQKYDYVCFTDGDIVYENNTFMDYLINNIEDNDLIVQSEGHHSGDVCTGFMLIKSNEKMIQLYDCVSEEGKKKYMECAFDNNDQSYFNKFVKPYCSFQALSLRKYPNGNAFYKDTTRRETAVLVHFNWVKGHLKMAKMKEHRMWLLEPEEEDV